MAHDADLALDALRPPAPRGCAYRALGCAVIHSVLRGYAPRDAASWLRGPDGRFWAAVGGVDVEALAERLRATDPTPRPEEVHAIWPRNRVGGPRV